MSAKQEQTGDLAFMVSQLMTGINTLSKSVSGLEDRVSLVESAEKTLSSAVAADSGRRPESGYNSSSGEKRSFAVRSEVTGEGEQAETHYYITNCRFLFGRRVIVLEDDFELPTEEVDGAIRVSDGKYYLVIPHEAPEDSEIADDMGEGNTDDTTVLPLFEYKDGKVVDDYRGMPTVPAYEVFDDVEFANETLKRRVK